MTDVPVVLTPRPFAGPVEMIQPAGRTVAAMLLAAVREGRVRPQDLARGCLYVDGREIDRDAALDHVLAEGQVVNVVVHAHGGGRCGGKDIGQILLQIAVIAVSAWVGGSAMVAAKLGSEFAARVAAAAVMVVGNLAVQSLYAPESAGGKANDRYALQSASNRYRPWEPMPLALGEVVAAPDLAVKTFTRTHGDDVWIYGILGLHYGPCVTSEHKIGDTLISSMSAEDVRIVEHLTPGPRTFSLYPNDTDQLDLQEELNADTVSATPVVRGGSAEGQVFEFDFFLPRGLHFAKDDGKKIAAAVSVTIRYRAVDANGVPTGAWTHGLAFTLTSTTSDPWRVTRDLNLPLGRYEFEVRRSLLEDDSPKRQTDIAWTAVRAIAFRKPIADETLSIIEFAVRATAINQGNLAPITCRITPVVETWDPTAAGGGGAWTAPQPSSNPAALTRWLMTGPAPAKPLSPIQADVGLRRWSELCDIYGWTSHLYLVEDRSQAEAMALLEAAGRASIFWPGSELVASPWVEKPIPRQMFTGVNLRQHRWTIAYPDPVHALRVEFANIEQGGDADELYVYADGYGETAGPGIEAATLVEALRLEGQRTRGRAWKDGRWELGRRKLQRRVDTWQADVEHIACRYGDRVRLAWQRAAGEGGARVRNRRWSGGLVSGLRLDRPVTFAAGETYCTDLRLGDQLVTGVPVVNPAVGGEVTTREIVFATPRTPELSPAAGHLIAFGVTEQVSEDVEIVGIEPAEGLTASLTGVRYVAPQLMIGETGPIPDLPTRLTRDRMKDPPAPALMGIQVAETGIRLGFSMPPWRGSPVTGFSARWRPEPLPGQSAGWSPLPPLGAGEMIVTTPALRDFPAEYAPNVFSTRWEIEVRAVLASGQVSPPLQATGVLPAPNSAYLGDWSLEPRPADVGGTQQPGLILVRTGPLPVEPGLKVDYAHIPPLEEGEEPPDFDPADYAWLTAYDGPMASGVPIDGLQPGQGYYVRLIYRSGQRVESDPVFLGPVVAPDFVAGDVSPEAPALSELTERVETALGDVATAVIITNDLLMRQRAEAERLGRMLAVGTALNELLSKFVDYEPGGPVIIREEVVIPATGGGSGEGSLASTLEGLRADLDGSIAALGTEATTRAGADSALSSLISALSATVTSQGTELSAQGGRLTTVEATLPGKASATDLATVSATVTSQGTEITAQGGRLTTVEAALPGKASAADLTTLSATVSSQGSTLASHGTRLTTAEADIAGKASASDYTALSATVTSQGTEISSQAGRLTTVEAALPGKASASDLSTLSATVSSQGTTISGHSTRLDTAEADIAGKASASSVSSLGAAVTSQGTSISGLITRVDTAEADIAGKASSSSVTSLNATVGALSATVSDVSAVAASAEGIAKAIRGLVLDVNGYVSGWESTNDGLTSQMAILASVFSVRSPGSGLRWELRDGVTYIYDPDAGTRTMYGKSFGGSAKLVWWTGPDSVDEGDETKGNAYIFLSMVAPRIGGSDFPGGLTPQPAITADKTVARNNPSVSTTQTATVTIAAVNGAAALTQVRWQQMTFDYGTWGISNDDGATTYFIRPDGSAGDIRDVFQWFATNDEISSGGIVVGVLTTLD